MMFKAYGSRVLDTRTRVWYQCASKSAAVRRAQELNKEVQ